MIAKLATDPLLEYIRHLKALSSETLHELNLPIATIKTNLSLIKRSCQDEKIQKRVQRIQEATAMLTQRYEELEYLIKTQTMKKIRETFDIKELVENLIDFLKNIYPSHQFVSDLHSKEITNDPIGLGKVIDNLVDNAVKYSSKNSKITITFQNNTLAIQDEGEGIDEVEMIKIFDRYYQINDNAKGFGIGLAMVKKFCDSNDIELLIDSKRGKGTTIQLKFKG